MGFLDKEENSYDGIADLEKFMEELRIRKKNIEMKRVLVDNIYRYLLNFNQLYDEFTLGFLHSIMVRILMQLVGTKKEPWIII